MSFIKVGSGLGNSEWHAFFPGGYFICVFWLVLSTAETWASPVSRLIGRMESKLCVLWVGDWEGRPSLVWWGTLAGHKGTNGSWKQSRVITGSLASALKQPLPPTHTHPCPKPFCQSSLVSAVCVYMLRVCMSEYVCV